jgi:flagellar basal-body rod protein FlgB
MPRIEPAAPRRAAQRGGGAVDYRECPRWNSDVIGPGTGCHPKGTVVGLFDLTTDILQQALVGASQRQSALSANIANANTPGYVRQDVDFQNALAGIVDNGGDARSLHFEPEADRAAGPVRADGNTVDTDTEMASLAQNSMLYQAIVAVQRSRFHELESVIKGA